MDSPMDDKRWENIMKMHWPMDDKRWENILLIVCRPLVGTLSKFLIRQYKRDCKKFQGKPSFSTDKPHFIETVNEGNEGTYLFHGWVGSYQLVDKDHLESWALRDRIRSSFVTILSPSQSHTYLWMKVMALCPNIFFFTSCHKKGYKITSVILCGWVGV